MVRGPAKRIVGLFDCMDSQSIPLAERGRWVYELTQNAIDAGATAVKLHIDAECVRFSHNGRPFTITELQGLINPTSSKDEDRDEDAPIGQFGTGLVFDILSIWY